MNSNVKVIRHSCYWILKIMCIKHTHVYRIWGTMEAMCSPKRPLTFNGLHDVIIRKILLFLYMQIIRNFLWGFVVYGLKCKILNTRISWETGCIPLVIKREKEWIQHDRYFTEQCSSSDNAFGRGTVHTAVWTPTTVTRVLRGFSSVPPS
jgi:hypothetical protein